MSACPSRWQMCTSVFVSYEICYDHGGSICTRPKMVNWNIQETKYKTVLFISLMVFNEACKQTN